MSMSREEVLIPRKLMTENARLRVSTSFLDENGDPLPSRTKQQFKAECDINNVIKKYDSTGLITHVNKTMARFGDYTEVNEYQESLNIVIAAQEAFSALPSALRKRFGNDPGLYVEFVTDPKNEAEMISLGMAVERPRAPATEPAAE